ncbi:hypothetical protein EKO27_g8556 [Xylaria grammica]|uniref:Uncharacterized protein n=1 Tax=Xylaria grammica TaxID=363999 RepID=A0A439CWI3_9PEZI|nr:hypothetical protein EKO27_g8556 [Xylaria grammica]
MGFLRSYWKANRAAADGRASVTCVQSYPKLYLALLSATNTAKYSMSKSWEIEVHAVSPLMERLKSSGQLDLALNIGRLAFDPACHIPLQGRVQRFLTFRDEHTVNTTPLDPAPTWENNLGIIE